MQCNAEAPSKHAHSKGVHSSNSRCRIQQLLKRSAARVCDWSRIAAARGCRQLTPTAGELLQHQQQENCSKRCGYMKVIICGSEHTAQRNNSNNNNQLAKQHSLTKIVSEQEPASFKSTRRMCTLSSLRPKSRNMCSSDLHHISHHISNDEDNISHPMDPTDGQIWRFNLLN